MDRETKALQGRRLGIEYTEMLQETNRTLRAALRETVARGGDCLEFLRHGIDPTDESDVKAVFLEQAIEQAREALNLNSYETCGVPMIGFYGAETSCARPKGHSGEHYQVYGPLPEDR